MDNTISIIINNLFSEFKTGNYINVAFIMFLVLISFGIIYILKNISSLYQEKKRIRFSHDHEINTTALQEFYGPLYLYVFDKKNLGRYSPDEALIFLSNIKIIINKNPFYSTTFLDNYIFDAELALNQHKTKYSDLLVRIRTHIITMYTSLRHSLNYPTPSLMDNFFTNYPSVVHSLIFFWTSLLCSTIQFCILYQYSLHYQINSTKAQLVASLLISLNIIFILSAAIFFIFTIIDGVIYFLHKINIWHKWFAKDKHNTTKKKHQKHSSPQTTESSKVPH